MADGVVTVKQALDGDRPIDNELVLNDVGAMVYRQKVAVANFPAVYEIANDLGNPIPVRQSGATVAVVARVAASVTAVTLLLTDTNRAQAIVYNETTATLYVKLGTGASITDYTIKVAGNGGYYEVPIRYLGPVSGVWDTATGFAQVTEF